MAGAGQAMEWLGVLAAVLSSGLGGTSVGATRYLAEALDPLTLGALRFGIGALLLLPLALRVPGGRPQPGDWPGLIGLGLLFFGLFPILFNASLIFTTAARGGLALSTLPLLTMAVAALLRVERFTWRKAAAALIALGGVAVALWGGLAQAPADSWLGDLMMLGGTLFLAFYTSSVSPSAHGSFYELYAIAAAVLGGCSLRGGEGSIPGIVLGTVLLQILQNLVNLLGIPTSLNFAVMGTVILAGVLADQALQRRRAIKVAEQQRAKVVAAA